MMAADELLSSPHRAMNIAIQLTRTLYLLLLLVPSGITQELWEVEDVAAGEAVEIALAEGTMRVESPHVVVALAEALAKKRDARVLVFAGCGLGSAASLGVAPALAAVARRRWLAAPGDGDAAAAVLVAARAAHTGVWADTRCSIGRAALVAAARRDLLNLTLSWLVGASKPPPDALPTLRMDSDVIWAQVFAKGAEARLWSLYAAGGRGGRGGAAEATAVGQWVCGEALLWRPPSPPAKRRLRGQELRGAVVLVRTLLENLERRMADGRDKHIDAISKHNVALFMDLQPALNYTLRLVATGSWGYPSARGWDGVVGLLQRREVELGVSCCRVQGARMDAVSFSGPSWPFRSWLVFRQPASGSVRGGALLLPFGATAWAAVAAVAVALLLGLRLQRTCERHVASQQPPLDDSWAAATLTLTSVVCLQGAADDSTWLSWRLLVLSAAGMALVLDSCYAAGVVTSLLLPPPASIRSKWDLAASSLSVGAENMSYTRDYFKRNTDPEGRELWRRKMAPGGRPPNYLPLAEGVERVRTHSFAYHAEDVSLFPLIARSFSARQRCSLGLLPLFRHSILFHTVQKRSPLREAFTAALRRAWEVGLVNRRNRQWHPPLPLCSAGDVDGDGDGDAEAVDAQALAPAFLLLLGGVAAAAAALVAERHGRRQKRLRRHGRRQWGRYGKYGIGRCWMLSSNTDL